MTEFLIMTILLNSGKSKTLDRLGYIMQISDNRYDFDHPMGINFITSALFGEEWKICEEGLSEIIRKDGISQEESLEKVRKLFIIDLANQFTREADGFSIVLKSSGDSKKKSLKELRHLILGNRFLKTIYYKFRPPTKDVTRPESKYFNDFKIVKDFLEKNR